MDTINQKVPILHCLIPARSGSKSILDKNIKIYKGDPLLAKSIKLSKQCMYISKTVVSTDSYYIKQIAESYGAECPFIRPAEISGDYSLDIECFQHYINWLSTHNQKLPDILVHLRPTYPERTIDLLNNCIHTYLTNNHYDSLRTVVESDSIPFKQYVISGDNLEPLFKSYDGIIEPYNSIRQIFPTIYSHNGCIDIVNRTVIENGSMSGKLIYPYVMPKNEVHDIDTMDDWEKSENKSDDLP